MRSAPPLSPARAASIPSTAANHSRHLLLRTANAVHVAKSANSGFEASGMRDMVAASVLWRRVGAACAPHTSARRSACAASAINTHPNNSRQCHVTRSAAVPRVSRVFQLRARVAGGKGVRGVYDVLYSWAWCERGGEGGERRRREEGDTACARAPSPHRRSFLRSRRRAFFSAAFKRGWPAGSAACDMTTASRAQSIAFRISPACS